MLIPSPDVGARERLGASFHRYIHSAAYLPSPPSSVFNVLLSAALQCNCNIVLLSEQSTFFLLLLPARPSCLQAFFLLFFWILEYPLVFPHRSASCGNVAAAVQANAISVEFSVQAPFYLYFSIIFFPLLIFNFQPWNIV